MTEARTGPVGVFWGRVDRADDAFRARCGVRDAAGSHVYPESPETDALEANALETGALEIGAFASYDDARSWVHLSAAQAGFRSIAWDADSCAAPDDSAVG
ncbi:MAG: hypothetical protein ACREFY_02415 [Acetobacteraceae bacterium]